jgi:hypothetical protein
VGTATIQIEATNQFGGRCQRQFPLVVAELK